MATALAAVRLQPWQPDNLAGGEVQYGSHGNFKWRVRAFGGYPNKGVAGTAQQYRGKICRVPLFRTSSPVREALASAMSEERDITDMQETDKVSGEWWEPILTAVRNWSHDKLLGLAELADGSLFFSFGPGSDSKASRPAKASSSPQPKAHSEAVSASTHNLKALPQRHPSSFRKLSPIPASRKNAIDLKTAKEASPKAAEEEKKPQKKDKAKSPSKSAAQPQRPASSFSKRSPIPKERVPAPISKKKKQATETASSAAVGPPADSPASPETKEILDRGKESAKSSKTSSAGTPAKKKAAKVVVIEETAVEVALTSSEADSVKKRTPNVAVESEETVVDVAAENGAVSDDLGSYKLPELRSLAKAKGLKGYSKLKKGELVDLLAGLES